MGLHNELPCSIRDVVDVLGIPVIRDTGTQLHCRCPFCDDRKAHLNIKVDKDVFRCNRCGEGGGVLHLYAAAMNIKLSSGLRGTEQDIPIWRSRQKKTAY